MPQNNEVIAFLIATGIVVFLIANRKRYTNVFSDRILILSFAVYFGYLAFGVIEDLPVISDNYNSQMNFLQHLCNLIRTALLVVWLYIVLFLREGKV